VMGTGLPANRTGLTVLARHTGVVLPADLQQAGRGEIAAALTRDGCAVRATHFRDDDYKLANRSGLELEGIPIDAHVDLTRPLTHPDAAFDLVIPWLLLLATLTFARGGGPCRSRSPASSRRST